METKQPKPMSLPEPEEVSPAGEYETSGDELDSADQTPGEEFDAVDEEQFSWESAEYVHRNKGIIWFIILFIISIAALVVAIYFKVWTLAFLVVVVGVTVGVYARRTPKIIHYTLGSGGITVDHTHYEFEDFRSYGIIRDEALYSAILLPIKRFMPAVNLSFDETQGEKIVDVLGAYLPVVPMHEDLFSRILKRVRF